MSRIAIVRQAILELGDASDHDLSAFIEERHGIKIEPKWMLIYKATIRELDNVTKIHQVTGTEEPAPTPA